MPRNFTTFDQATIRLRCGKKYRFAQNDEIVWGARIERVRECLRRKPDQQSVFPSLKPWKLRDHCMPAESPVIPPPIITTSVSDFPASGLVVTFSFFISVHKDRGSMNLPFLRPYSPSNDPIPEVSIFPVFIGLSVCRCDAGETPRTNILCLLTKLKVSYRRRQ